MEKIEVAFKTEGKKSKFGNEKDQKRAGKKG